MKTVSEEVDFNLRFDEAEGEWKAEINLRVRCCVPHQIAQNRGKNVPFYRTLTREQRNKRWQGAVRNS